MSFSVISMLFLLYSREPIDKYRNISLSFPTVFNVPIIPFHVPPISLYIRPFVSLDCSSCACFGSQFDDDTAIWAASKNVQFAAKLLRNDLRKLAKWCAKSRIKLNPEKNQGHHILKVPSRQKFRTHSETVW